MQPSAKKLHRSLDAPLVLLGGGAYQAAKGEDFPPHRHSHWELVYYRSGALECVMEQESRPGYPGLVWLTPPGVRHAEKAVKAYANYYIALKTTKSWPVFFDDDGDGSLGRLCQQIVVESRRSARGLPHTLNLLASQLICLLDRASSETATPPSAQVVSRAERVIEEQCGQPLTITEVARAVFTSPSTLRSYFHRERGCSPRDHLRQARLVKAVGFLRTSTLKLETVAELCGYDSASHLTRCVKKATGRTPGQIRRA